MIDRKEREKRRRWRLLRDLLMTWQGGGGGGAAITSPLPATSRVLEFYAGNGTGIYSKLTTASGDGSAVSAWGDETATYTVAQGTGGNQPVYRRQVSTLNNRSAVQFDGIDDYLSQTVAAAISGNLATCTLYCVFVNTANGTAKIYDEGRASSATPIMQMGADSAAGMQYTYRNDAASLRALAGGGATFNDVGTIFTLKRVGGNVTLYRDGTQVDTNTDPGGTLTIDRLALGVRIFNSTGFFKGWLALARVSNADDRTTIEPLLKAHYGIA